VDVSVGLSEKTRQITPECRPSKRYAPTWTEVVADDDEGAIADVLDVGVEPRSKYGNTLSVHGTCRTSARALDKSR